MVSRKALHKQVMFLTEQVAGMAKQQAAIAQQVALIGNLATVTSQHLMAVSNQVIQLMKQGQMLPN